MKKALLMPPKFIPMTTCRAQTLPCITFRSLTAVIRKATVATSLLGIYLCAHGDRVRGTGGEYHRLRRAVAHVTDGNDGRLYRDRGL